MFSVKYSLMTAAIVLLLNGCCTVPQIDKGKAPPLKDVLSALKTQINGIGTFDLIGSSNGGACGHAGMVEIKATPDTASIEMKTAVGITNKVDLNPTLFGFLAPDVDYSKADTSTQDVTLTMKIADDKTSKLTQDQPDRTTLKSSQSLHDVVQAYLQAWLDMNHDKPCFDPNDKSSNLQIATSFEVDTTTDAGMKITFGVVSLTGTHTRENQDTQTLTITMALKGTEALQTK